MNRFTQWERVKRPNQFVSLNRNHPLFPYLRHAWIFRIGHDDLVTRIKSTITGELVPTLDGVQVGNSSNTIDSNQSPDYTELTVISRMRGASAPALTNFARPIDADTLFNFSWNNPDSAYNNSISIKYFGIWITAKFGTLTANKYHTLCGTVKSSSRLRAYTDGFLTTETALPGASTASATNITFGKNAGTGDLWNGIIDYVYIFNAELSPADIKSLTDNPYQLLAEDHRLSYVYAQNVTTGGAVTHATTGALTGQGSTLDGTAVHNVPHGSSGALTGQGSTVDGSASRTRVHANTGALEGQGTVVSGTAAHIAIHTSSGALTGQGSTVDGSASRTRVHANTGALEGQGTVVSGTAAHIAIHTSSGALTGQGSTVDGASDHVAAGGTHTTTGALTGQGAVIDGSAARIPNHQTSGTLTGQGSTLDGTAVHNVPHGSSGALTGQGSTIDGEAVHVLNHQTSGDLAGQGAVIDGSAARVAGAVSHDTSGDLIGIGSELSGVSQNGTIVSDTTQNSGGFVDFGTLRERRQTNKKQEEAQKPKQAPQKPVVESKPKLTPVISELLDKSAHDYVAKSNVIPLKKSNDDVKKSLAKQKRIEREKQLLKEREEIERQLKEQEEKELEAVRMLIAEYQLELQEQEDELILQFMLEL